VAVDFKDRFLKFNQDSIIIENYWPDGSDAEVMMDWEDSLMKRHAEVVCENGGDILEIGFGMGMSANYIQAQNPNSHTIVEIHPQVIEKLEEWAADKPNVIVVKGSWYDKLGDLGIYDGVFYDVFGDSDSSKFKQSIADITKQGSIITFWNNQTVAVDLYGFETSSVTYEKIEINPPKNTYYNDPVYYLPKVVI